MYRMNGSLKGRGAARHFRVRIVGVENIGIEGRGQSVDVGTEAMRASMDVFA